MSDKEIIIQKLKNGATAYHLADEYDYCPEVSDNAEFKDKYNSGVWDYSGLSPNEIANSLLKLIDQL
jgi:hypothetical protein